MLPGASSPPIASMAMRTVSCQRSAVSLCLFDRSDRPPLVVAALAAHLMGSLGFLTLGTCAGRHRLEGVVGAALGGTRLRVPPFRIGHLLSSPCLAAAGT